MSEQSESPAPEDASTAQAALRKNFPTLYITLVSIVVALAVEGLLSRLADLDGPTGVLAQAVLLGQISIFIFIAAVFWWISARWVITIPWRFGFFDGLSMIVLLVAFHYVSQTIGADFANWITSFGVFAIAGGALYRWNGLRGIRHTARSPALAGLHRLPSAIPVITGVLLVASRPWGHTLNASPELQLAVVLATAALCAAFAYADYVIWNRASAEPGRFDATN